MFHKAYECKWCKKDLKGKEIPSLSKAYYPQEDTHFTLAIDLFSKGFECEECGCRWDYEGNIFKDGIEELKDKYKIKEDINNESEENKNNI